MTGLTAIPQPETKAGIAMAEEGLVILDGPSGIAVTMTREAAVETGKSLISAAAAAGWQVPDRGDENV